LRGLGPRIHVFAAAAAGPHEVVDGRDKPGRGNHRLLAVSVSQPRPRNRTAVFWAPKLLDFSRVARVRRSVFVTFRGIVVDRDDRVIVAVVEIARRGLLVVVLLLEASRRLNAAIFFLVFPAKAGIHFHPGHRPSPV
jgi:hypothetical protein